MGTMNTAKHIDTLSVEELEQAMRDPDHWDWEHPVPFEVSPDFGMYYTLRFSGEESELISDAAEAAGMTILDYMQHLILTEAARQTQQ